MTAATQDNRHPADALFDVRAEIKILKAREEKLRVQLLAPDADRVGAEWEAQINHQERERLDSKAVVEHFGREALRPFLKTGEVDVLRLKPRKRTS